MSRRRIGVPIGVVVALTAIGPIGPIGTGSTASAASAASGRLAISAADDVTCAKLPDGTARCWGNRKWGQLGNAGRPVTSSPVTVQGLSHVDSISAGTRTTCAVLANRSVKCWGFNLGTPRFGSSAVEVPGFASTVAISVRGTYACAVRLGGTIRCMGGNSWGQLGHGDINKHATPVGVRGIANAVAISAGTNHACALLADKTVKCWGKNRSGELGTGSVSKRVLTPVAVNGISGAIAITAGDGQTCALLANRTVKCWGSNTMGQLGTGRVSDYSLVPVAVSDLIAVSAISAGSGYTCAAMVSGTAACWGYNSRGELGNGTVTNSPTPVGVRGVTNAVEISTGLTHACVVLADNTARCWGDNGYGKTGTKHGKVSLVPVAVPGL